MSERIAFQQCWRCKERYRFFHRCADIPAEPEEEPPEQFEGKE